MVTWKIRGCPKCGGDMICDDDWGSFYEQCLQCGFRRDIKESNIFDETSSEIDENLKLVKEL